MGRTEFGEQQLRDCVNFCLIEYAQSILNSSVVPNSPTPCEEKTLGWDTAFFLPWLGPCQAGKYACNLFIQYKVSHPYTGKWGQFGKDWGKQDYYMFNLAKVRRGVPEFQQIQNLTGLEAHGFTVVYVTNHISGLSDLFNLYGQRQLLDKLPALKVKRNIGLHVHATFTQASKHFYLHSDLVEETKTCIMSAIKQTEQTEYKSDLDKIEKALFEQFNLPDGTTALLGTLIDYYRTIYEIIDVDAARELGLRHFMKYYLNLHWHRFPKIPE